MLLQDSVLQSNNPALWASAVCGNRHPHSYPCYAYSCKMTTARSWIERSRAAESAHCWHPRMSRWQKLHKRNKKLERIHLCSREEKGTSLPSRLLFHHRMFSHIVLQWKKGRLLETFIFYCNRTIHGVKNCSDFRRGHISHATRMSKLIRTLICICSRRRHSVAGLFRNQMYKTRWPFFCCYWIHWWKNKPTKKWTKQKQ